MFLIVSVVFLSLLLAIALWFLTRKITEVKGLKRKYGKVIDIDVEVDKGKAEKETIRKETEVLRADYKAKREIFERLLKELSVVEENLEFTSIGVYSPHFDFDTSEEYKETILTVRAEQKEAIRADRAIVSKTEWEVGGSKAEGRKMTNRYKKLMLRAFNNECDSAIAKVKWNNVTNMEERIRRAFDAINKMGEPVYIEITHTYRDLKTKELRLTHERQEKINDEKEEQRAIREQMREEEKVRREVEKKLQETEKEEARHQKALEQVRGELEKAEGKEREEFRRKIAELEKRIEEKEQEKERTKARAESTRSGHIYVISNIGSFGQDIYKIGMTRRLEPLDRVKELGDASVPFAFDIHAMIYSDDAPRMETELHKTFDDKRINLVNNRKEFFKVSLAEIEREVLSKKGGIEFTKIAEAQEYHKSVAIRKQKSIEKSVDEVLDEKFPEEI